MFLFLLILIVWNPTTEKCFTCKEQKEVMLTIRYHTFWFCQEKWKLRVSHLSIQKMPNNGVNSSIKEHSYFHAPVFWRDIDEKNLNKKVWNLKKKISWKHRCMKLRMYSSNRIDFDQLKWILIAVLNTYTNHNMVKYFLREYSYSHASVFWRFIHMIKALLSTHRLNDVRALPFSMSFS